MTQKKQNNQWGTMTEDASYVTRRVRVIVIIMDS